MPESVAVRKGGRDDWGLRYGAGGLDIAFKQHGEPNDWPVVPLHAFFYHVRCYDEVVVSCPYVRRRGSATRLVGKQPGEAT